jgi:DNA-binding protein H-NS
LDISNLSVAEIKQLQIDLKNRLKDQELAEQLILVDEIRTLIEESGFEYRTFTALLHEELRVSVVKYRHPEDAKLTWSGRGRWPFWLRELVDSGVGKGKEDFAVKE